MWARKVQVQGDEANNKQEAHCLGSGAEKDPTWEILGRNMRVQVDLNK